MFKRYLSIFLTCLPLALTAAVQQPRLAATPLNSHRCPSSSLVDGVYTCTPATEHKAPARLNAPAETFTVTPVLSWSGVENFPVWDNVGYYPDGQSMALSKATNQIYYCEIDFFTGEIIDPFKLPAGEYDFIFTFHHHALTSDAGIHIVIHQNITVSSDMEIKADAADAENHIMFDRVLTPDGEILTGPERKIIDGESQVIHAGNTMEPWYITWLYSTEAKKNLYEAMGNIMDVYEGNEMPVKSSLYSANVWINDCEGYSIAQLIEAFDPEKGHISVIRGSKGVYTQNVGTENISYQPVAKAEFGPEALELDFKTNSYFNICNGVVDEQITTNATDPELNRYPADVFYYSFDPENAPQQASAPAFFRPMYYDEEMGDAVGIWAPICVYSEDKWTFRSTHSVQNGVFRYLSRGYLGDGHYEAPTVDGEIMPFDIAMDKKPIFGSMIPSLLFVRPAGIAVPSTGFTLIGQLGESPTFYEMNTKIQMLHNDEVIANSREEIENYFYDNLEEIFTSGLPAGTWQFDIESPEISIEGASGTVKCTNKFVDGSDGMTPTVTQLQMRDTDGNLTDRFEEASQGVINIMAAEFHSIIDEEAYYDYFETHQLKKLTVEYAPAGTGDWSTLPATMSDAEIITGYGNLYTAPTASVTKPSADHWYDLRITCEDHDGNTQVQTLAPAFKIEVPAAITVIGADDAATAIDADTAVYTLDGRRADAARLAPGIYITVRGTTRSKILVK